MQPGMAFVMSDMDNLAPYGPERMAGNHPWLVTAVDDDYVEIVMCSTVLSAKEDKYRLYSLEYDNVSDIPNACPPLDSDRMSKASLDTFMLLPKKELFSHTLMLCNNNTEACNFNTRGMDSLCLNSVSLRGVQKDINQYLAEHPEYEYDPFACIENSDYMWQLENDEVMNVPKMFTKEAYEKVFGWKTMDEADKSAVYPTEKRLHPYEIANSYMMKIIRNRDAEKPWMRQRRESTGALTERDLAAVPVDSWDIKDGRH